MQLARASSTRPLKRSGVVNTSSPRSCGRSPRDNRQLIAEGYEYRVRHEPAGGRQGGELDGAALGGDDRCRHAQAAEAALRARVAKAMAQIEALNQRGRGKKRFETVSALRQAVVAIVQRYGVEDLVWFRLTQHVTPRPGAGLPGAASADRPRSPCHRRGLCGRSRVGGGGTPVGVARVWHQSTG